MQSRVAASFTASRAEPHIRLASPSVRRAPTRMPFGDRDTSAFLVEVPAPGVSRTVGAADGATDGRRPHASSRRCRHRFWSFRALCLVFSSSGYCLRPSGFRIVVVGLATAGPAAGAGCPRPTPPPLPSCSLCRLRLGRPARASPPLSPPLLAPLCASWPRSRLSSGCTWAICLLKMGPAGRRSRGGASAVAPTAAAPGARSLGLAPASGLDSRAGRCPSTAACPS